MENLGRQRERTHIVDGRVRKLWDADSHVLVLRKPSGTPIEIEFREDGWLLVDGVLFGVPGLPPLPHAGTHSANGPDPISPESIQAVPKSQLSETSQAGKIPVLDGQGKIAGQMVPGHAESHKAGGQDVISPEDIGAVPAKALSEESSAGKVPVMGKDGKLDANMLPAGVIASHAESHGVGGSDPIIPDSIGALPLDELPQRLFEVAQAYGFKGTEEEFFTRLALLAGFGVVSQGIAVIEATTPDMDKPDNMKLEFIPRKQKDNV